MRIKRLPARKKQRTQIGSLLPTKTLQSRTRKVFKKYKNCQNSKKKKKKSEKYTTIKKRRYQLDTVFV